MRQQWLEPDAPELGSVDWQGWDERFGDFLIDLHAEGLADSTLRVLKLLLKEFNRWLVETYGRTWNTALPMDFSNYLGGMENKLKADTISTKRWGLRRLYAWAGEQGIIQIACKDLEYPLHRTQRPSTIPPTPAQIEELMHQPDISIEKGVRDRAILELLYATGLRASELLGLSIHQIGAERCIRVMGKGKKERLVVYGEHAQYWLARYIEIRKNLMIYGGHSPFETDQLFVNIGKKPNLQYTQLLRIIKKYGEGCGLCLTPHTLRHAFATHLYVGGASLSAIQMLLGHANLQTSSIYMAYDPANNDLFLNKFHPRGSEYQPFKRWQSTEVVSRQRSIGMSAFATDNFQGRFSPYTKLSATTASVFNAV